MKKTFLMWLSGYMILFAYMFVTSCSNEEDLEPSSSNVCDLTREDVVDLLKDVDIDIALSKEIHNFVSNSLSVGRDEDIRIGTMLSTETRSNGQTLFAQRLKQTLKKHSITRGDIDESDVHLLDKLVSSDFIIYWPYSEDWDGKELPTLVAAPKDKNVEEAYGLKITQENGRKVYQKILLNEEYAMKHPVWVINEKKDDTNVTYLITSEEDEELPMFTRSATDSIYVWKLTRMKVTHQYDTWFYGGSEFDVQVAYPVLPGYTAAMTTVRVEFSRKTIRKENWKYFNHYLNTNWRPEQINNGLSIFEKDDGDPMEVSITVNYKINDYSTGSSTIKWTISDDDDHIGQLVVDRDFIIQNGEEVLLFDNSRVRIIAPLIPQ